ncbi:MAG: glycosyltransferase [Mesorhizobium sp.]|uniref:glycosyltransferase n=1 Tax=unclassified Mesorhizobium TaxID=325217 RepID=UPI000FC9E62D|nr:MULTISPECIES: glycosyltransferase [unclassified Mesorhizobium]RVC44599.1 glycosyltransferase [Mesorhizobium sp. M4A.F.Ca.ET.090.04.2.1]RWC57410.1 MAG: glycosyltransferase [Mesorhizobium sp.]RWD05134.1 MAG: glycosyltransferase [Mesorhizobium sp.]RWD14591.1 MAG: glycosyltransferase [Mesorhizobium sp.]RWD25636.1 MAG: glycosyltransferase [Mesorhizobium sp.]
MKVLFAGGNGYTPQFSGGVQSSTHHLVEQLRENGHEASVLAALFGDGMFGFKARAKMKLLRQRAVIDTFPGYPVVRAWFPWEAAGFAVDRLKPDVAVVQCHKSVPIGRELQALGVPLVVYLRNVEFHELAGDLRELRSALYIANSEFTARTYKEKFGIDSTVIPPTINPGSYSTPTTREFVTMINPYNEKGFELAVRIAGECPEIPFLFVESWMLDDNHRAEIERTIAPLGNATLESRTSDMKTVYGRTKILLAPSKWEEAWGRVASEAHCSGIPVVGSRRGGLPEAIGAGGVVLDYDAPLADWVATVRRLWSDKAEYDRLSAAAQLFSERPQMNPDKQFATFLDVLNNARRSGLERAA